MPQLSSEFLKAYHTYSCGSSLRGRDMPPVGQCGGQGGGQPRYLAHGLGRTRASPLTGCLVPIGLQGDVVPLLASFGS